MALLAFRDVHALYGQARILNGVTFDVAAGERVALVGRNGVGKTTVVNTLCGATRIAQGHIALRGRTVSDLRGYTAAQNGISIVLQGRGILPNLTVEENLLLGTATGRSGPWSLKRIYELFPILAERSQNPGMALSGGQQQMLAIGRALVTDPKLLLLDEPTAGMAPAERGSLMALIVAIARDRGLAVLFTEHDMDVVFSVADRIMVLHQGRVIAEGIPSDVRADRVVQRVYLGEDDG